ncbi:hypothetical protein [Williamsia sp. M5A3_1d]
MVLRLVDVLEIFVAGDQRPGCILYSLWSRKEVAEASELPLISGLRVANRFQLQGGDWVVEMVGVEAAHWPDNPKDWSDWLRRALNEPLTHGARATWMSSEGGPYADPPNLFDENLMSGGVFAWALPEETSRIPLLDEQFVPAPPAEMSRLRSATVELSAASDRGAPPT